mgnify:FL=1
MKSNTSMKSTKTVRVELDNENGVSNGAKK